MEVASADACLQLYLAAYLVFFPAVKPALTPAAQYCPGLKEQKLHHLHTTVGSCTNLEQLKIWCSFCFFRESIHSKVLDDTTTMLENSLRGYHKLSQDVSVQPPPRALVCGLPVYKTLLISRLLVCLQSILTCARTTKCTSSRTTYYSQSEFCAISVRQTVLGDVPQSRLDLFVYDVSLARSERCILLS